ncbi:nuclear transport factor 2 family protein [Clostridium estertheticum]|uniref:Nuclear transport factor 2 family protein n=1 Tax=Clostridium estertheticum TaxID=238834 RepID=A0AA47I7A1_9CLOT|nr:nuclear transport factor 2 family protein [Clostridium estertheticum]MBU3155779.1 nuclear transport factor 2 family protein [Clostridium estertheticum]MBU3201464.1 nuclear transport factor 2 family protein [Clostridium estertheticum]WAG62407.1 nuclear transport factor 2 family protein [Clostridium estertheticum]WAG63483.1 nuclear transport factor 2 family protein [Clostridium estertheticum]
MSLEILQAKLELRELVDAYSNLGDEKKLSEQMHLLTPDHRYMVYMGDQLVSDVSGTKQLLEEFTGHASFVKRYFSINAQHIVKVDGDTATGVAYSQLKMVREEDGKEIITDYSVKYDDTYVRQNGNWLIKTRIAHFIIIDVRTLQG